MSPNNDVITMPDSVSAPPIPTPSRPSDAGEVDAVLAAFGLGRRFYPVGVYFLYSPIIVFFSWQMFILTFAAWQPEWRCRGNASNEFSNSTTPSSFSRSSSSLNFTFDDANCSAEFSATAEENLVVEWNLVSAGWK